ncbi:MAG: gluconokinase [Frankia sp.]|nr:gluconokinase [Frankia sp.]
MAEQAPSPASPPPARLVVPRPRVLVVTGVAGSGKTTVARAVAERLGWPYAEADDLHPRANIVKMAAGVPLTDSDRWPWLVTIAHWIRDRVRAGEPGVVTCSALRRRYRDILRAGAAAGAAQRPGAEDPLLFVYLRGSPELIGRRMAARRSHFMPTSLLDSQFAALEEPGPDEHALTVDVDRPPDALARAVTDALAAGDQ